MRSFRPLRSNGGRKKGKGNEIERSKGQGLGKTNKPDSHTETGGTKEQGRERLRQVLRVGLTIFCLRLPQKAPGFGVLRVDSDLSGVKEEGN